MGDLYQIVNQPCDHPWEVFRSRCTESTCGYRDVASPSGKLGLEWLAPVERCEHDRYGRHQKPMPEWSLRDQWCEGANLDALTEEDNDG